MTTAGPEYESALAEALAYHEHVSKERRIFETVVALQVHLSDFLTQLEADEGALHDRYGCGVYASVEELSCDMTLAIAEQAAIIYRLGHGLDLPSDGEIEPVAAPVMLDNVVSLFDGQPDEPDEPGGSAS